MPYEQVKQGDVWDFAKNPEFEGIMRGVKHDVGENKSNLYSFTLMDVNETPLSVWGSTVLDGQLEYIQPGQRVKITFLGMKPSPKRKGKEFKDFQVLVWKD